MHQQDRRYGELWRYERSSEHGPRVFAHDSDGEEFVLFEIGDGHFDSDVGAERAVACVNAFSGVPHPERLPELIKALKAEAEAAKLCSKGPSMFSDGEAEHEQQRLNDRLLAATIRRISAFRAMLEEPS